LICRHNYIWHVLVPKQNLTLLKNKRRTVFLFAKGATGFAAGAKRKKQERKCLVPFGQDNSLVMETRLYTSKWQNCRKRQPRPDCNSSCSGCGVILAGMVMTQNKCAALPATPGRLFFAGGVKRKKKKKRTLVIVASFTDRCYDRWSRARHVVRRPPWT
jgi:hypothetical protein